MIELTKTDGAKVILNPQLIECIESGKETVVLMNSGRAYVVRESAAIVLELLASHCRRMFHPVVEDEILMAAQLPRNHRKRTGEEVETGSEACNLPD